MPPVLAAKENVRPYDDDPEPTGDAATDSAGCYAWCGAASAAGPALGLAGGSKNDRAAVAVARGGELARRVLRFTDHVTLLTGRPPRDL
jgi:hypothetical protein